MHCTVMFFYEIYFKQFASEAKKKFNTNPEKVGFRYMNVSILLSMALTFVFKKERACYSLEAPW